MAVVGGPNGICRRGCAMGAFSHGEEVLFSRWLGLPWCSTTLAVPLIFDILNS
jgi:hypothetical protein